MTPRCAVLTGGYPGDLECQINEHLKAGWQLHGSPIIWHTLEGAECLVQVVVHSVEPSSPVPAPLRPTIPPRPHRLTPPR